MLIFRFLTFLLIIITVPVLFSDKISPAVFWPVGFATYLTLPLLIINLILLFFWIYKKSWVSLFLIPVLLLGLRHFNRTFSISLKEKESGELSVLSYNVRVFNAYAHLSKENPDISNDMIKWINEDDSDIKCFQDFYNDNSSKTHNTLKRLSMDGKYKYYFTKTTVNRIGASFGLAVFSKYPIVKFGNINFEKSFNKGLYVDIKIKDDTIRIIDLHLESMSIDEDAILKGEGKKGSFKNLLRTLKSGMIKRAQQLDEVEEVIISSPYKIILCGDLNDMPYTYSYDKLRGYLRNSFEDAGKGFGFSYNGKLFFLRIDNQFYSKGLKVKSLNTLRDVKYSDHFPLKGTYELE